MILAGAIRVKMVGGVFHAKTTFPSFVNVLNNAQAIFARIAIVRVPPNFYLGLLSFCFLTMMKLFHSIMKLLI